MSAPYTQRDPPRRSSLQAPPAQRSSSARSSLAAPFTQTDSPQFAYSSRHPEPMSLAALTQQTVGRLGSPDSQLSQYELNARRANASRPPTALSQRSASADTGSGRSAQFNNEPLPKKDKGKRKAPNPWTDEEMILFLTHIRNDPKLQNSLLPGHKSGPAADQSGHKSSNNSLFRKIIDECELDRDGTQLKSKLTWFVATYKKEMELMGQTGKGLLLTEMEASGGARNAREALLRRHKWFDVMHEMMRNRDSSDPDLLVTSAGEIHKEDSDGSSGDDASAEAEDWGGEEGDDWDRDDSMEPGLYQLHGDHGSEGLTFLAQASLRAELDGYQQPDPPSDFEDAEGDSQMLETTPRSNAVPRRGRVGRAQDDDESDNFLYASEGPSLSRLADESQADPMAAGSSRGTSRRNPASVAPGQASSPAKARVPATPGGRALNRTTAPPKTAAKRTQSKTEVMVDKLSKDFLDARHTRAELAMQAALAKEQTRQMRIEVKHKEMEVKHKEMERKGDDVGVQLATMAGKLENIQLTLNQQSVMIQQLNSQVQLLLHRQAPPFSALPFDFSSFSSNGSAPSAGSNVG